MLLLPELICNSRLRVRLISGGYTQLVNIYRLRPSISVSSSETLCNTGSPTRPTIGRHSGRHIAITELTGSCCDVTQGPVSGAATDAPPAHPNQKRREIRRRFGGIDTPSPQPSRGKRILVIASQRRLAKSRIGPRLGEQPKAVRARVWAARMPDPSPRGCFHGVPCDKASAAAPAQEASSISSCPRKDHYRPRSALIRSSEDEQQWRQVPPQAGCGQGR